MLGDRMCLRKNRTKCGPPHFLPHFLHNFHYGKSNPKIGAAPVIKKKLAEVNNRPKDEKSGTDVMIQRKNGVFGSKQS
jgi:hypothetical protein